jgi:hypothetical protein
VKALLWIALASLLALPGCTTTSDLSFVSNRDTGLRVELLRRGVRGVDCLSNLSPTMAWIRELPHLGSAYSRWWSALFRMNPSIENAVEDALRQAPGAQVLTDVSIAQQDLTVVLFTRTCIRVEGNAGRLL